MGSVSFQDINIRQSLFQEELEDLIKLANENKARTLGYSESLVKKDWDLKNEEEEQKKQQIEHNVLLKELNECRDCITQLNKKMETVKGDLQTLTNEDNLKKDELKETIKILKKAIRKYSTTFNMDVQVKKCENEDMFVASVKFKPHKKTVEFLINKKDRTILDFDAGAFLSTSEMQELKHEVMTDNGLNIGLLLYKLRHI